MEAVTITTIDDAGRYRPVTLVYIPHENKVYLMGLIPHGSQILVNQELVDNLQKMVNELPK